MEISEGRTIGKGISHAGWFVAAILILTVAASAQQTPAAHATPSRRLESPCLRLARRTHRNKHDVCLPAGRQAATPTQSKQARAAKLKLIDLPPINPMAFAKTLRPSSANSSPKTSAAEDSTVTEFQVASGIGQSGGAASAKNSKRTFLKDVHGEAYGALAPGLDGGHAAGGAVGAGTKSGKTHIFIETEHSRVSSSQ